MLMQASLGGELWTILRDRGTHAQLERLRVCNMHALLLKFGVHMRSWRVARTQAQLARLLVRMCIVQLEILQIRMHSWSGCEYTCAVGEFVSTQAQFARLRVHMHSWRGCMYACAVGEVVSTHVLVQLKVLWVRMRSWRSCEYTCASGCEFACAVEWVASMHAQLKGLRVRSAVGYLLSQ